MRLEDFDYALPEDRIAQVPLAVRDASRLLVLNRATGAIRHDRFAALPARLGPKDLVVLNDTKVLPARLVGRRAEPGTGGRVETLLLEKVGPRGESEGTVRCWRVLMSGGRRPGDTIDYGAGLRGRVLESLGEGFHLLELTAAGSGDLDALIQSRGRMPLPPYIHRDAGRDDLDRIDRDRYQTVVAAAPGAVAAPTAGLHFTHALIERIRAQGTRVETITLHVGPGTFQPIRSASIDHHVILPEAFVIPGCVARAVAETRRAGGRVIAVGTTVTRALESNHDGCGGVRSGEGTCTLFIRPGHRFGVIDALITNFHLPRTTLLMLVAAFAGRERVLRAYREAVAQGYRFYSYGDAMLIEPPGAPVLP